MGLITSEQIRAVRSMLRITVAHGGCYSVGVATMKRIEASNGVPPAHARTSDLIQRALIELGVAFVGSVDDAPGVRLRVPNEVFCETNSSDAWLHANAR